MRSIRRTRCRARRRKTMATKTSKKVAAKAARLIRRYIFVGSTSKKAPADVLVFRHFRFTDLPASMRENPGRFDFVSCRRSSTDDLLQEGLKSRFRMRMGNLLTLEPPRPESLPSLIGLFDRVIGATDSYRWLPR